MAVEESVDNIFQCCWRCDEKIRSAYELEEFECLLGLCTRHYRHHAQVCVQTLDDKQSRSVPVIIDNSITR
jgi:hypothetical protein